MCSFLFFFFPVKVSQFAMFRLDNKKVDYETNCFSLTPLVISTHNKQCATVSSDR